MNGDINIPYRKTKPESLLMACIGITGVAFVGALFMYCLRGGLS